MDDDQQRRIEQGGAVIKPLGDATESARRHAARCVDIARRDIEEVEMRPELETEEDVASWARHLERVAGDLESAAAALRLLSALGSAKIRCWGVVAETL